MEHLQSVLNQYNIKPHYVEEERSLYKLYTWEGVYSLKEIKRGGRSMASVFQASNLLMEQNVRVGVPIVPTKSKQLFSSDGSKYYYLTPWLEANERTARDQFHDLFKLIAKLHKQTTKEREVDSEQHKQTYQYWLKKLDERKAKMENFLDYCEEQIYMSPFELNYCLHANEMLKIDIVAKQKLEAWYEKVKENKKERVSLCHGAPGLEHLVYHHNNEPYFINFERSFMAPAAFDLEYLIHQQMYRAPASRKGMLTGLQVYQRIHSLTEDEKLYLSFLLLNNDRITRVIEAYQDQEQKNELKHVKRLQRTVWLVQNVSHVAYESFESHNKPSSTTTST